VLVGVAQLDQPPQHRRVDYGRRSTTQPFDLGFQCFDAPLQLGSLAPLGLSEAGPAESRVVRYV
jgi:hypothetical protein